MKANELMIGDWVSYRGICNNRIALTDFDDNHRKWLEDVQPIPLTTDILEKNGFRPQVPQNHIETVYACQDISEAIADELYALWPCSDGSFYLLLRVDGKDMVRMDVHYIHKLQHALRLCGIEKEIIL